MEVGVVGASADTLALRQAADLARDALPQREHPLVQEVGVEAARSQGEQALLVAVGGPDRAGGEVIVDSRCEGAADAAKGALVANGYGMTETGPTAFVGSPDYAVSKIGSVGKPQLLLDVRIVDAQGRDVAEGETGEIWMRGPGVTPRSRGDPQVLYDLLLSALE